VSLVHRPAPVRAWPNMTEAAEMIGVHVSTLSRDPQVQTVSAGARDKRLAPTEVLRLTEFHKRRSLNDVAQALISHAATRDPSVAAEVETEVERYFSDRNESTSGKDALFADLQRVLPRPLYEKVKAMYFATEGVELDGEIVSDVTDEELASGR